MSTTLTQRKRKSIDLPMETIQKLSAMAVANGKTLKAFIEDTVISAAEHLHPSQPANPSPSGDKWFADPANIDSVKRGIADKKAGRCKPFSTSEIKDILGA